jgi:hypothetical protein
LEGDGVAVAVDHALTLVDGRRVWRTDGAGVVAEADGI